MIVTSPVWDTTLIISEVFKTLNVSFGVEVSYWFKEMELRWFVDVP